MAGNDLFAPLTDKERQSVAGVTGVGDGMGNPEKDIFAPLTVKERQASESIGDSPDNPVSKDLFGSNIDRVKSSFGNPQGIAKLLSQSGYVNVSKNNNGDLVAKGADGKWYKDENNILGHPINWAESKVGEAWPMAKGIGGGIVGGIYGGKAGAIAGAGAGAAAGELDRQGYGRLMGTYDGGPMDVAGDAGKQAALMAGSEGVGRLILGPTLEAAAPYVKPYLDPAVNAVKNFGKSAIAKTSELMTGVPKEAVTRLMERPNEVLGAGEDGAALQTARNAQQEFLDRNQAEKEAIQGARQKFRQQFGNQQVDTTPLIQNQQEFVSKVAPTDEGIGPVRQNELENLSDIEKKGLITTELNPMSIGGDLEKSLPTKSAGDLQKLADQLDTEIKNFDQSKVPGSGDTRYQAYLRSLYGKVKGRLHEIDPEGLGAADAKFSQYATDAGRLGRLENPDTMEGFINNFYGKNKSIMRESAQNVIPNSVEDIADLGANRAFTRQGPAGSEMGGRRIGGLILDSMALHSAANGQIGKAAIEGTLGVGMNPEVHRAVIGNAAKAIQAIRAAPWFQSVKSNPELLQAISNPSLRYITHQAILEENMLRSADHDHESKSAQYEPSPKDDLQPIQAGQKQFLEGN